MSQEVELKSVAVQSEAQVTPVEQKQESPAVVAPAAPESGKEEKEVKVEKKPSCCKTFCKRWFIDAFGGMALGLFCTLIAGLILKQIGSIFGTSNAVGAFFTNIGTIASVLMGCGIGAGIGHALGSPRLVIFCAIVNGFVGANASGLVNNTLFVDGKLVLSGGGDPISAYIAAIIAVELGNLIAGKTSIDILIVPLVCLITGSLSAYLFGPPISLVLASIGAFIEKVTTLQPVLMGIVVAVIMGVLLTLPTSSAAIGISIGMTGISAGAASAGCACQMVGFAVSSFRENRWGGLIAQGLGTSMLQIPNLVKAPQIFIPPIVASIVSGPISAAVFKLKCNPAGSGMGTSGLVGVLMTYSESYAELGVGRTIAGIVVCFVVIPAVVSLAVSEFMRKKGWIKMGDMTIVSK